MIYILTSLFPNFILIIGGFAHVYLVRMNDAKEQVVLKRIAVADQDGLKSVNKEVAAMVRICLVLGERRLSLLHVE